MSEKNYKGSCLCGEVKFKITGEFNHFFFCHCSRCRQTSGSAHGANLFSKSAKLDILSGSEKIKDYLVPDTRFMTTFCSDCGSKLPKDHNGKMLQVPAGSLASTVDILPTAHIFCGSRANWENELEKVEKFETHWKK